MKTSLTKLLCSAKMRLISSSLDFTGKFVVKGGQLLTSWLIKLGRVIIGSTSRSWVRIEKSYLKELHRLWRNQGMPGVVKYLKACSVYLQQSVANQMIIDSTRLGPKVSRTKSGIPRIIPAQQRKLIRKGDRRVIRFWMSLFALYRVLEYPGNIDLSSITNIGKSWLDLRPSLETFKKGGWMPAINRKGVALVSARRDTMSDPSAIWSMDIKERIFWEARIRLAARPFVIRKSSPLTAHLGWDEELALCSTSMISLAYSAKALVTSSIWKDWELYASKSGNDWIVKQVLRFSQILPRSPDLVYQSLVALGKLGAKDEPAGKVRIFAMVDPWTQWLLKPLHDTIFDSLRKIDQDGTFDQMAPVNRLLQKGLKRFWCYDLSSATDRLPVDLQVEVLADFFGLDFAQHWKEILVGRHYAVPKRARKLDPSLPETVKYAVGQPMGALSSWAMLALTHHFIVQWAAFRVHQRDSLKNPLKRPFSWFTDYAVLGDDIVLAQGRVAREYLILMESLGVKIGLAKSLVSRNGTLEFAKRFITPAGDASPISLLELGASLSSLLVLPEFVRKYELSHATALMLLDYGFRVRGNIYRNFDRLSGRCSSVLLVLEKLKYSFEEWLTLVKVGEVNPSIPTADTYSEYWARASRKLVMIKRQALSDRIRSLVPGFTVMARYADLDISSKIPILYTLNKTTPRALSVLVGAEIHSYLRTILEKPVLHGSLVMGDTLKKLGFMVHSTWPLMSFKLLREELERLEERLDELSDLSSIDIKKEIKIRDKSMSEIALWRAIHQSWRKPIELRLSTVVESAAWVRDPVKVVVWSIFSGLIMILGWLWYSLWWAPRYLQKGPRGYRIKHDLPTAQDITSDEILGELVLEHGWSDYAFSTLVGLSVALIIIGSVGLWWYSDGKIDPPGGLSTVEHGISIGPYTPNTLLQVREDLAVRALEANLDLSPIGELWQVPPW